MNAPQPISTFSLNHRSENGFTLVEVMISLALGLVISAAIIQILASSNVTERLNRAVASTQESGRFIINRLRNDLLMVGMYNELNPNIDDLSATIDLVEENQFVRSNPIILPGQFALRNTLGSTQGENGASDTLVVSLLAERDCRGYKLGYATDSLFFAVNEYFLDGDKLKCRGFDGRYLRGQKVAAGHNSHAAFTLLDGVEQFQVTYGISSFTNSNGSARPTQFVDADESANAFAGGFEVVAIRLAVLIKSDSDVEVTKASSFKLLNEDAITTGTDTLYKSFETTVTLRNMKNFVRSSA